MKELLRHVLRKKLSLVIEEDVLANVLEIAKNNGVDYLKTEYDYWIKGRLWCLHGYVTKGQYINILNDLEDQKVSATLLSGHGFRSIG